MKLANFYDLSKAFDYLLALEHLCGVRGKTFDRILSYLLHRRQMIELVWVLHLCPMKFGATQGLVLGPLLFISYINEMLYNLISVVFPAHFSMIRFWLLGLIRVALLRLPWLLILNVSLLIGVLAFSDRTSSKSKICPSKFKF